ncbi:MAG: 50S ribosomal protein L13 [Planctomycetota bacterium]
MSKTTLAPADRAFDWYEVDASRYTLGHLAVAIAETLMGKRRPDYTPHVFSGDGVVVVNAGKVKTTGLKHERRIYTHWTGYVGGLRETPLGVMRDKDPRRLITLAVRRMLPKNKMGKLMLERLKVYAGPEHPHAAQKPQELVVHRERWTPKG